jgi:DNA-binding response OmpR family regulator
MDQAGGKILLFTPGTACDSVAGIVHSRNNQVVAVNNLPELLEALKPGGYDLAIIEMLPGNKNIIDFSVSIRNICQMPVLFLLPSDTDPLFLNGIKNCGDDFLFLPVRENELILRFELILSCHRKAKSSADEKFSLGRMSFDYKNQMLDTPAGSRNLTRTEAELLHLLCLYKNQVLTRETALEKIWGENDYFKSRSMDVYVAKLRKLFRHDTSVSISNIHNVGFRLNIKESVDGRKASGA